MIPNEKVEEIRSYLKECCETSKGYTKGKNCSCFTKDLLKYIDDRHIEFLQDCKAVKKLETKLSEAQEQLAIAKEALSDINTCKDTCEFCRVPYQQCYRFIAREAISKLNTLKEGENK